jgi:hypothetical protein
MRSAERAKHVLAFKDPGAAMGLAAGVCCQTKVRGQERGELGCAAINDGRLKHAQQAFQAFHAV